MVEPVTYLIFIREAILNRDMDGMWGLALEHGHQITAGHEQQFRNNAPNHLYYVAETERGVQALWGMVTLAESVVEMHPVIAPELRYVSKMLTGEVLERLFYRRGIETVQATIPNNRMQAKAHAIDMGCSPTHTSPEGTTYTLTRSHWERHN
jgi:hypothetical protein